MESVARVFPLMAVTRALASVGQSPGKLTTSSPINPLFAPGFGFVRGVVKGLTMLPPRVALESSGATVKTTGQPALYTPVVYKATSVTMKAKDIIFSWYHNLDQFDDFSTVQHTCSLRPCTLV